MFCRRGAVLLISPIVNSSNEACNVCSTTLLSNVGALSEGTSIVAPGLARTYLLTSCSVRGMCDSAEGSILLPLTARVDSGLQSLSKGGRSMVVANVGYESSGSPFVCGLIAATGNAAARESRFFSRDFSNANSLFTSIVYKDELGKFSARRTTRHTKGFLCSDVTSAVGSSATPGSKIGFRGFLQRLV